MAQCLQGARVDGRLTGAAPDRREELPELMHLRHALELFDVHFRYARRRRRPTTSEPAWTASEATIAIAKAGATPPGSSQNASTAKNAAKPKSPSSRPRITAMPAATPCRRWANAACETAPARMPTEASAAKCTPGPTARKKAIGPEVKGMPTSQPPTSEPQRRLARLAAPMSAGVSVNFRMRMPTRFASAAQQGTGLDSRVFQRLPHGGCDRPSVRGVAVN